MANILSILVYRNGEKESVILNVHTSPSHSVISSLEKLSNMSDFTQDDILCECLEMDQSTKFKLLFHSSFDWFPEDKIPDVQFLYVSISGVYVHENVKRIENICGVITLGQNNKNKAIYDKYKASEFVGCVCEHLLGEMCNGLKIKISSIKFENVFILWSETFIPKEISPAIH